LLTVEDFQKRIFESGVIPPPKVVKYGDEISAHLHIGPDFLWSPDTNEYTQLPGCIALFEETRTNQWGKPIGVDAGYRTIAHEKFLESKGLKTAKNISPHSLGSANDYKVLPGNFTGLVSQGNTQLRTAFRMAAVKLGLPQPRIGWKAYGSAFIHIDLMFTLFAPYTTLAHPQDWLDLSDELRETYRRVLVPGMEW
jgi:hypothetical protein